MKKRIGSLILLLFLLCETACNQGPFTEEDDPPGKQENGDSPNFKDGPNFQIIKSQVFSINGSSRCLKCHADFLSSFEKTKEKLVEIEGYLKSNGMPLGGPPLPDEAKELFYTWVRLGAPE